MVREFHGCWLGLSSRPGPQPSDFAYDCLVCDFEYEKTKAFVTGPYEVQCLSPKTIFEGVRTLTLKLNRIDIGSKGTTFSLHSDETIEQGGTGLTPWVILLIVGICVLAAVVIILSTIIIFVQKKRRPFNEDEMYLKHEDGYHNQV